jgi:hypothetical protein
MKLWNKLQQWFQKWTLTPEEIYLNQSCDISDLEQRMRNIEYSRWQYRNGNGRFDNRYIL